MSNFKSGFVGIIGRPNAGKSTLINALLGEKIVIISTKPQTTRQRLKAILTTETAQIVFYDTPGLHKPLHKLGEEMNRVTLNTLSLVDFTIWLIDATQPPGKGDLWVSNQLKQLAIPILVVFNKIDLIPGFSPGDYLEKLKINNMQWTKVSALKGLGLSDLLREIEKNIPVGPCYYPDDMITDQPEYFLVAELIREEIINETAEEIPYSVAVVIDEMKRRSNGMYFIRANIFVEKDSQKKIIIGKNGQLLKKIGAAARGQIEKLLECSTYLDLWVKTKQDWRNSTSMLKEFGYVDTEI